MTYQSRNFRVQQLQDAVHEDLGVVLVVALLGEGEEEVPEEVVLRFRHAHQEALKFAFKI